jgi:hypothetical protein
MKKSTFYNILSWIVELLAIFTLINYGISWWKACILVIIPSFVNYLHGLYRDKNYERF